MRIFNVIFTHGIIWLILATTLYITSDVFIYVTHDTHLNTNQYPKKIELIDGIYQYVDLNGNCSDILNLHDDLRYEIGEIIEYRIEDEIRLDVIDSIHIDSLLITIYADDIISFHLDSTPQFKNEHLSEYFRSIHYKYLKHNLNAHIAKYGSEYNMTQYEFNNEKFNMKLYFVLFIMIFSMILYYSQTAIHRK